MTPTVARVVDLVLQLPSHVAGFMLKVGSEVAFAVNDGIVPDPGKSGVFAISAGYDLGEAEVERHDEDGHPRAV